MSEDEIIEIETVVGYLEDSFWILNSLKQEDRYERIKGNEHYKRILEAIELLKIEHNALYELIKED